ncbi:MAG: cytochrome c oxidase assembly protein [Anderseniella sp.]|nr:cytochrome c oxidase assembly protein [Anderseniella sp.]
MSAGQPREKSNLRVAIMAGGVAMGMVGVAYAAVPLYQIFCQITGFGGTTQRADASPQKALDQKITVAFDANVNASLSWEFVPSQHSQTIRIGEQTLAFYKATNTGSRPVTGTATFNVTPVGAGVYFSKIECFCFTEQTLQPGQSIDMPVSYFVDPDIVKDPDMKSVKTITLSYTFYAVDEEPVKTSSTSRPQSANTMN